MKDHAVQYHTYVTSSSGLSIFDCSFIYQTSPQKVECWLINNHVLTISGWGRGYFDLLSFIYRYPAFFNKNKIRNNCMSKQTQTISPSIFIVLPHCNNSPWICMCSAEKQQIPISYTCTLVWPYRGSNWRPITLDASTLTSITPPMLFSTCK